MIRFIVETTSSKHNVYGNSYHYAVIVSTKTGKYLTIRNVGGPSNASHLLRKIVDWPEFYATNQIIPIRQWNARQETELENAVYEHTVTPKMLLDLEDTTRT